MFRKLPYKSAGKFPTNWIRDLFWGVCIECVGKFPTKVQKFSYISTTWTTFLALLWTCVRKFPAHLENFLTNCGQILLL